MWFAAILSAIITAIGIGVQAKNNRETNEANAAAVEKTNQANAEQAELAYKRSLPTRQVANMMAAGMSKSAALQSLSGGGSYSAPVMQSAQRQSPNLDFAALAERIGGIPSNAQQSAMVKQQLESMKLDNDIKREQLEMAKAAAARDAVAQGFNLERDNYDFETRKQTDALRAIISKRAAEFNVNLNDIKSEQDLIDKLKLNDVAEWRDARSSSRDNVLSYLGVSNTMRNTNRAASDSHSISKLQAQKIKAEINDFNSAKNAREKEYAARELRAELEAIATEMGIADAEFQRGLRYVYDNFDKLSRNPAGAAYSGVTDIVGEFWEGIFKVIPLNALGKSVLGNMINIK